MDPNEDIDYGTDELNDPNYGVDTVDAGDGNAPITPETPDGAQQVLPEATPQTPDGKQQAPDTSTASPATPPQQSQQPAAGAPKTDAKGNLVDGDGKVIASAGADRRQYERNQRQVMHITNLERELTELRDASDTQGALNGAPQVLGLDARETEMGLQAIASFKKDPVATARWMLQETMRLGYNLKQIVGEDADGQVAGGSMDLNAIKSMIADQVGPLLQDRNAQQQATNANQSAQREYSTFVAKHEFAELHQSVIANMLNSKTAGSPEAAYWQLREYATKNQLDFTQPLGPQMQAKQGAQPPASNGNVPPQAQQIPMPQGSAPTQQMQTQPTMADPDANWDTIVQQSLAEAGFT